MGKVSASLFILIILLFLLPWITVSCGNQKIFTFSGTDLAFGKTIENPQAFGSSKKETVSDEKATAAFFVCIAGIFVGFLVKADRFPKIFLSICGGIGGSLIYLLKMNLDKEIVNKGQGILTVDYHFGFWLTLLLFFTVGILNVLSLTGGIEKITSRTMSSIPLKSRPQPSFCSNCGTKAESSSAFCSECGRSLR